MNDRRACNIWDIGAIAILAVLVLCSGGLLSLIWAAAMALYAAAFATRNAPWKGE